MNLVEAYFDESSSHDGAPILCLAGYLFTDDAAKHFTRIWADALAEFEIPYFRMSECAHGNGAFKHLSRPRRVAIAARMIATIKRTATSGFAVTLANADFGEFFAETALTWSPYTFCAHSLLTGVQTHLETVEYDGNVAYVFESGHKSRGEADAIMNLLEATLPNQYRGASHAFVSKTKALPLQAGDMLAWQWYTDRRHRNEGRPRRKDLESLLEIQHASVHLDRSFVERFASRVKAGTASFGRHS